MATYSTLFDFAVEILHTNTFLHLSRCATCTCTTFKPGARALSVELFSTARPYHSSLSREQFQTVKHGGAAAVT